MDAVTSLETGEIRHHDEVRITPSTFFRENIKMVPEIILHEPIIRGVSFVSALSGLAAFYLMQTHNIDLQGLSLFAGYISIGTPLVLAKEMFAKSMITNPIVTKPYPDIIGWVPNKRLQEIISDGIRGFYSNDEDVLLNVYSAVGYKRGLIEVISKQADTESKTKMLWQLVFKTPDPELKLSLIKSIEKNCKGYLQDEIVSQIKAGRDSSQLEEAALSYLAVKWNLLNDPETIKQHETKAERLNFLELKTAIKCADKASREIIEKFPGGLPDTLIPFVRLYTLRRTIEALVDNQLPSSQDEVFVSQISNELIGRLKRFDILEHESKYNPEAVTIGMEIQPTHKGVTVLRTDKNDIKRIISYAEFRHSPDKPFEFVLPPTRTPVAQLLILQEILFLTGIPIEQAGIQISFGGIGKRSTVEALQRMVLSAGRLNPNWKEVTKEGAHWSIWTNPGHKGEVDIKNDVADVVFVDPEDSQHPEFKKVGEMRARVGAESFFVFARGLMVAHRLAGFAKAYERSQNGHELMGVEVEVAKIYDQISSDFNEIFREKGMPDINQKWHKKNWQKFALLVNDKEIGDKFKRILSEALS